MKYGYARISTKGQKLERQLHAFEQLGLDRIFTEKESGSSFQRSSYQRLLRCLKKGDQLYIKSIDRLGRNYTEIIEQWRYLVHQKQVDIIVLDFPLLNTSEQNHGLTGKFLADLVLQTLSYVAQIERENIRQRQQEGIYLAKQKGVQFGRKQKSLPANGREVLQGYLNGSVTSLRKCADMLGVSHMTVKKWLKELESEQDDNTK